MWFKRPAGALLLALAVAACSDEPPTSPDRLTPSDAITASRGAEMRAERAAQRASVLPDIPIQAEQGGETVPAFLSITELGVEEVGGERQLTADGIVSYITEDGQYLAETFTDVPLTLSRTPTEGAPVSLALQPTDGASLQQVRDPNESGVCDILFLSLGPLDLNLLGLTVELSNIELDLDAVPGAGNLLGNLLCAVTGLLDGGPLGAILDLLGQINGILDGLNSILSGIDVIGSILSGATPSAGSAGGASLAMGRLDNGQFEGELTVTRMAWDSETGQLLVDGVLNGKARVGKKMQQVRDAVIENVPATLDDEPGSALSLGAGMAPMMQRAPNEDNVCDVLYLDLAPTFLDVLGLTVDLSQVELDVDAVPGGGNLLGNLLCAVTGLLDGVGSGGGLGGLLQGLLQGLLDAVNQLLGGLSL